MLWIAYIAPLILSVSSYKIVREYSGRSFFDRWDFYGSWDNLTNGDVWWVNRQDAASQKLAFVNSHNHAIIKVDNSTNVPWNQKRNSVRITSTDHYGVGSLWIIDLLHLPWGCSVWPAFWTKGNDPWPHGGEIDIIEGVNLQSSNQMALHSLSGCKQKTPANQKGKTLETDCSLSTGCSVLETASNSFGAKFAAAGGGVWAVQFDVAGIFMWFWSRPHVPDSIKKATSTSSIDISAWGTPSASYPASGCNIAKYFSAQQLVLDITLCGSWAGLPQVYTPQCGHSGPTGKCYDDNVVGPGHPRYDDAYFEIDYLRAYTTGAPAPTAAAHRRRHNTF